MTDERQDERFDFSPIDPTFDAERFERILAMIASRAEPILAARRRLADAGVIGEIVAWRRPVLAAAAMVGLLAGATLALVRAPAANGSESAAPVAFAQAIGVPTALAAWVDADAVPSTAQLMTSLEELQ